MKINRGEVGIAIGSAGVLAVTLAAFAFMPSSKPFDTRPLGPVGTGLRLPVAATICVDSSYIKDDWPIQDAVAKWNINGTIKLSTDAQREDCDATVVVETVEHAPFYGQTTFYNRKVMSVQFSNATPASWRDSVTCHEFGHVLGLAHSHGNKSCMDPDTNDPNPTQEEIAKVSDTTYNYYQLAREAVK